TSLRNRFRRQGLRGVALGLLTACSCTQTNSTVSRDPFVNDTALHTARAAAPAESTLSDEPVGAPGAWAPAGRVRSYTGVMPVSATVVRTAAAQPVPFPGAIEYCPPDPRMPAVVADGAVGYLLPGPVECEPALPSAYPDEYLFVG